MSTKATQKLGNKESDRMSSVGTSAVYKAEKTRSEIRVALTNDEDLINKVHDFIFSGDPEAVSPLQEIRDANL